MAEYRCKRLMSPATGYHRKRRFLHAIACSYPHVSLIARLCSFSRLAQTYLGLILALPLRATTHLLGRNWSLKGALALEALAILLVGLAPQVLTCPKIILCHAEEMMHLFCPQLSKDYCQACCKMRCC